MPVFNVLTFVYFMNEVYIAFCTLFGKIFRDKNGCNSFMPQLRFARMLSQMVSENW